MTLVEILVAAVILMIIAMGSAAYIYQARAGIVTQRNKRIAIVAASSRLEELRATQYGSITNLIPFDYATRHLRRLGPGWQVSEGDPGETVNINGTALPISTFVRYLDIDGGMNSYDCLQMTVSVGYRPGVPDRVTLQTIYSR